MPGPAGQNANERQRVTSAGIEDGRHRNSPTSKVRVRTGGAAPRPVGDYLLLDHVKLAIHAGRHRLPSAAVVPYSGGPRLAQGAADRLAHPVRSRCLTYRRTRDNVPRRPGMSRGRVAAHAYGAVSRTDGMG